MSKSEVRRHINVAITPSARARLDSQAMGYGVMYGTRPSSSRMIEVLIAEKPDPARNAPCAGEIAESIQIEHAFSISYRTDDGRLLPLRILGGRIVAHAGEGKLLAFISNAPPEIMPYGSLGGQNFLLPLQRLECFEPSPDRFDLLKPPPYTVVSIQLSLQLAARYDSHPDDIRLEQQEDSSFLLLRRVEHSTLLLEQLVPWGAEARILTPSSLVDEIRAQLKAIAAQY